jgi:hypothetical protein
MTAGPQAVDPMAHLRRKPVAQRVQVVQVWPRGWDHTFQRRTTEATRVGVSSGRAWSGWL